MISDEGYIYEGFMTKDCKKNNFGRHIHPTSSYIGWWKNNQRDGNGMIYNNLGKVISEGWF